MTIAQLNSNAFGLKVGTPQGPIDTINGPFPDFRYGSIVQGDAAGVFVAAKFTATAGQVVKQGDVFYINNNFTATLAATSGRALGVKIGTFFMGGNYQLTPGATAQPYSYTFAPAGDYLVWLQVDGVSLVNVASTALTGKVACTTTTAGQIDAPTAGVTAGSATLFGLYLPATNYTFTATTVNGSPTLTNISTLVGIYPNMTITGTGIPGSTTIASIQGVPGNYTITLSANASASGSAVTMTCAGYVEAYLNATHVSTLN
jgi:hypothetical protein